MLLCDVSTVNKYDTSRYCNVNCDFCFILTGADVNMAGTMDNETPLETAVNSSNARCVKEIIQMYPKQLHVQVGD